MAIFSNQILAQTMPPIEAGVSHELAKWRAANYSDVRYKLNITLEKGAPLMKGEIEIRVNLTETGAKNDLILDWRTTQFANDKDKPFADVVAVNEKLVADAAPNGVYDYQTNKEHLLISPKFLKAGENVIKINFASPIKTSGAAITRYVDKEDGAEYIYSLFVPSDASTAFPVFDQPDLKAGFQLSVHAPKHWTVISNSFRELVLSRTEKEAEDKFNGNVEQDFIFNETRPISTYVFAFAAGEFSQFNDEVEKQLIENRKRDDSIILGNFARYSGDFSHIYVRKSQAEKFKQQAAEVFRLNREGVKFLEGWFDYKFPFPKYDLILIPEFPFGGMEHAGATFLREDRVIFPTEPTKNDYITRANVIFHEAAHQWFGDTVTMKWFDDLWLKEGFAEFMAYKTMEKVMPEYNAWKIFYERNKQAAYLTDATRGTTPIYQEISNLSAAKSAYGNIVYRKAPSFLRQAEFYLGEDKFQTAVRAFLKKHEFANAEWTDLVKEFETAGNQDLKDWASVWVTKRGMPIISKQSVKGWDEMHGCCFYSFYQRNLLGEYTRWRQKLKFLQIIVNSQTQKEEKRITFGLESVGPLNSILSADDGSSAPFFGESTKGYSGKNKSPFFGLPPDGTYFVYIPNYQDYGYGIFLFDEKSRAYVLANIQNEKDDFLRTMMWGALWDSVRETELAPKDYVELVIKNINVETDESTIQTLLGRVSTVMNYYLSEPPPVAGGVGALKNPSATADGSDLGARLEKVLLERMNGAATLGLRITFYRALLNAASTEQSKQALKEILSGKLEIRGLKLKTKDRFDIVTRLLILGDVDALKLLEDLSKTETSDEARRYAYAARAGIPTAENKAKFWNDLTNNKDLSESYIEAAFVTFNAVRHADLTLPYLEKALAELPNLKRSRKIFFVNGWLSAFIGGQRDERALEIVNKFLADNPNLDQDLRLKILEVSDNLERSIKIRQHYKS